MSVLCVEIAGSGGWRNSNQIGLGFNRKMMRRGTLRYLMPSYAENLA